MADIIHYEQDAGFYDSKHKNIFFAVYCKCVLYFFSGNLSFL